MTRSLKFQKMCNFIVVLRNDLLNCKIYYEPEMVLSISSQISFKWKGFEIVSFFFLFFFFLINSVPLYLLFVKRKAFRAKLDSIERVIGLDSSWIKSLS